MHAELTAALREQRFELHYQPLQVAASGLVPGVEALLRLRRPDDSLVPPLAFIPFAEESGLIETIGAWVIDEAVRQAAAWTADRRAVIMGINLSPRQIQCDELPATFAEALERHDIRGEHFIVELTETALGCGVERVQDVLGELRSLGIAAAVDDFGADYSSLSRLSRLPLQMFKLDRSFMRDVTHDQRACRLVTAIVGIGRALELRTVIEGIETEEQLAVAVEAGADLVQGYHLGRPEPAERAVAHLTRFDTALAPVAG